MQAGESGAAYEVAVWDTDGRNIISRSWHPTEELARAEAVTTDRTHGPGSAHIARLTWVGVDPHDDAANPLRREELPTVDPSDPDLAEYLRLRDKFDGLVLPRGQSGRQLQGGEQ